ALSLDSTHKLEPIPALNGTYFVQFSPNGRWMSYTSGRTGRSEIFLQPYPAGNPLQGSFDGGEEALWSPKGDELYYRNRDMWMVVPISYEPAFKAGPPRVLFRGPFINVPGWEQDVAPDGRFLMLMPEYPETAV